jgi:hypothetical protein
MVREYLQETMSDMLDLSDHAFARHHDEDNGAWGQPDTTTPSDSGKFHESISRDAQLQQKDMDGCTASSRIAWGVVRPADDL